MGSCIFLQQQNEKTCKSTKRNSHERHNERHDGKGQHRQPKRERLVQSKRFKKQEGKVCHHGDKRFQRPSVAVAGAFCTVDVCLAVRRCSRGRSTHPPAGWGERFVKHEVRRRSRLTLSISSKTSVFEIALHNDSEKEEKGRGPRRSAECLARGALRTTKR